MQIARGGIARVFIGRAKLEGGRHRRVAIKRFCYEVDDDLATRKQKCIRALTQAGVRLPPVALYKLDGRWVQITPLFGSRRRGSKFRQPANFFRLASPGEREFAADQLARVANAGYRPSIDLFVLFDDDSGRLFPIDLDLIEPDAPEGRAKALLKCIVQLGESSHERDHLLEVARRVIEPALRASTDALFGAENSPFRALWRLD